MTVKDYKAQVTKEDTLRVLKESIHDSMYEGNRSMIKHLDKIGDRLANVVEDFQKKQSSRNSRNRDRDRSNSRDRNDSRDRYRNNNRSRNCLGPIARPMLGTCSSHSEATACLCSPIIRCPHST